MASPSPNKPGPLQRAAARLPVDRTGAAAVEFALLLPVLVVMLAGLIDVSRLVRTKLQVQAAAQAGADYAQRKGWDLQGVSGAVTAATSPAVAASPAPQVMTACVTAGAIAPTAAATCPNGRAPARFVTASAQTSFTPIAPWPGLATPASVSAHAVARLP